MKKSRLLSLVLALACALSLLTGCGSTGASSGESVKGTAHEPITINAPYRNIDAFVDKVHEQYPEINLEIVPYSGQNTTNWMRSMLKSGNIPDIYFTTIYSPENEDVSDQLLDLSGYAFTGNYVQARLKEVTDHGAIYMLPMSYSCFGITYNKTLLEENGWTLPNSLEEMAALAPQVEAAGYNFCTDLIQFPGYGFQYLCNILDTGFLSSNDGLRWQHDYLSGAANVSNTPAMLESMNLLQRWKDIGLLNDSASTLSDDETRAAFTEGNTLFCVGNTVDFSKDETVTDEFKLMPYLSEDGSRNVYILSVGRYAGLNKQLADEGNEQKLEDALHVMEVLSTEDGMWALNDQRGSALLPLKDATIESSSYYSEVISDLNDGHTAPFIYSGWEDVVVPVGESMMDFISGKAALQDVIDTLDSSQSLLNGSDSRAYTTVTETLNTDDCAKLVGIAFAQATQADAALVSENEYHVGDETMNWYGVNGSLFPLPVTDEEMVSICPTGWNATISTLTLTGQRIKELAAAGYDMHEDGNTYPYQLVTRDGAELADDKTYTVAVCGVTDAVAAEGNLQDSGVVGLDALKAYFSQFDTLGKDDIIWN